ncbi:MAG TPA: hypothetical protein VK203_05680 [Nostocaceae cyanobacterium]|nr:hypothetical protein [Nostocaceae cyanobacterium]
MSKNNEHESFFSDDQVNKDKLFIDIPTKQSSPYQDRIPNGYDPMGDIYLRGRALRSIAGGRIPWPVLICGWILFGGICLLSLLLIIISPSLEMLILLAFNIIPLIIVWRGTSAKLSSGKSRNR